MLFKFPTIHVGRERIIVRVDYWSKLLLPFIASYYHMPSIKCYGPQPMHIEWCNCICRRCRSLYSMSWWRHQMETFSALLALCAGSSPVTGEFTSQRPAMRSFNVFFDLHLNKRLSEQPKRRWLETPGHPFWRHCKVILTILSCYNRLNYKKKHFAY